MMSARKPSEVIVKIKSQHIEHILNECMKIRLPIRRVKRTNEAITFIIPRKFFPQVEVIVQEELGTLEVVSFSFFEKYKLLAQERIGFFVGMILFVLMMVVLSQIIWKVEIHGANSAKEHEISQIIKEMGIAIGQFSFRLPPLKQIQSELLEKIEGITWIGVQKEGTTYRLEVVEQTLPEEKEAEVPRHLIAKKTAVIHSIYAEKGQVLVEENELVRPGDMLISGFIGRGKHAKAVAATGKVLGETWYQAMVSIPIQQQIDTLTGQGEKKYALHIGTFRIPVWGFLQEQTFEETAESETYYRPDLFEKWNIPIAFSVTSIREKQTIIPSSERENLRNIAKERGRNELKKRLGNEAMVTNEKVLHEQLENGKVKIVIHYEVIEDITSETPIIRGE